MIPGFALRCQWLVGGTPRSSLMQLLIRTRNICISRKNNSEELIRTVSSSSATPAVCIALLLFLPVWWHRGDIENRAASPIAFSSRPIGRWCLIMKYVWRGKVLRVLPDRCVSLLCVYVCACVCVSVWKENASLQVSRPRPASKRPQPMGYGIKV